MSRSGSLLSIQSFIVLLVIALLVGGYFRFPGLANRPMHTDEAILAMKTCELMRSGKYVYDPKDYHGPALHYLTAGVASLSGWTADSITETDLRWVIALCGMGLIAGVCLLSDALGRSGAIAAALICAVSPMMAYYNRYYIMESLLVLLLLLFIGFFWRWSRSNNLLWLALAGGTLGLMHATKETFVLNVAALFAGWYLVKLSGLSFTERPAYGYSSSRKSGFSPAAAVVLLLSAALVSIAFYSSFFRNWSGVKDSFLTYGNYIHRSGGSGHEKPWYYYFGILFWHKDKFVWTEAMIGGLAALGLLLGPFQARLRPQKAFALLLGGYAVASLLIYSVIPYKTPWSIMGAQHAMTLMAGVGFATVFHIVEGVVFRFTWVILFVAGLLHLWVQSVRATDRYQTDPANPYVYSHTSRSVVELSNTIHELAKYHPDRYRMPVQIINTDSGWPLPWYLRDMPRVGYQTTVPDKLDAPVIVVDTDLEEAARAKLKKADFNPDRAMPFVVLRPGVFMQLLVSRELWWSYKKVQDPSAVPEPEPEPEPAPPPAPAPAEAPLAGPDAPTPAPNNPTPPQPGTTPSPSPADPLPLPTGPMPPPVPVAIPVNPTTAGKGSIPAPDKNNGKTPHADTPSTPGQEPPKPADAPKPVPGVPRAMIVEDDPVPPPAPTPPPAPAPSKKSKSGGNSKSKSTETPAPTQPKKSP